MSILFALPRLALGCILCLSVAGCNALTEGPLFGAAPEVVEAPAMQWDHRPEAGTWTATAFAALDGHASILPELVPADIAAWCPAYETAPEENREAFWVGLMSALARYESTHNPQAVGGGGQWFGLVQISPATARGYGCNATSGNALTNGAANISCALRIWSTTVARDGVISAGRGGIAADWGPMVQANKREEMRAWMLQQPYCTL